MIIGILALSGRILLLGYERIAFKKAGEDQDPFIATFLLFAIATIFFLPILFFYSLSLSSLLSGALTGAIYSFAFTLYVYILSRYEISLVTPFYNFNVFFLLLLTVIFLGESFTLIKIFGIILLFYGTSFLSKKENLLQSFKSIFSNHGCQLMIIASLFMAVGRVIDRIRI